jgi:hypothetical protein
MELLTLKANTLKYLSSNMLSPFDDIFPWTVHAEHCLRNLIIRTSGDPVPQTCGRNDCVWEARKAEVVRSHNFFVGEAACLKTDFQMSGR